MNLDKLKKDHESKVLKATSETAVKVSKRICELFVLINQIQPLIEECDTGMGSWSFSGKVIGISNDTEDEDFGKEVYMDAYDFPDMVKNNGGYDYDIKINKACSEIIELLDYLIDTDGLNCSTWQDGFCKHGVSFVHSETSSQGNPFATPNKAYHMDNDYYRGLVKAGVPICFIDKSEYKKVA